MSNNSHLEIAWSSIQCFADDGTLDMEELNFLIGLAMRDGQVDENEKRVLAKIFEQVAEEDVSKKVWDRIQSLKIQYGI